ncbi:IL2RA protein, partial [Centropus bengalensis]|nr:IL2RA protein [Centropus bengalensis]
CPALPWIEFADVTAETYAPGTILVYECDNGYTRQAGHFGGMECKRNQQGASWNYREFNCIASPSYKKPLLSTGSTMELDFTQTPEIKAESPAPQKKENLSEFGQKDFCGPPKAFPHTYLSSIRRYYEGQVLHFKCQTGFDKRLPTSGTSSCKKVNGKITWTPLEMRCTNDS